MLLWLKALHIVAVIAWMAGLLYLPRLFVYHVKAKSGPEPAATLAVMEQRLLGVIMNPAMIAVWLTGPLLAWQLGVLRDGWLHMKLALVVGLTVFHHLLGLWRKDLASGRSRHGERFYRLINEIPTLAMIAIVILVVVKPF
jgi:protoporphyrinogen IX oxidase